MNKKIKTLIFIVAVLVFLFSAFQVAKTLLAGEKEKQVNSALRTQFVTETKTDGEVPSPEEVTLPIAVDFAGLKEENEDIIGWLYCPDTPIHYPVVQGEDNQEYLHRDINKKYLSAGCLFADYRNKGTEDENFIIYGHNMKNGSMFGTLERYREQSYFDSHSVLYFLTPEENYLIHLVAGKAVKDDDEIYNSLVSEERIKEIIAKSSFASPYSYEGENIITLSTCSYDFQNARFVLIGILEKI